MELRLLIAYGLTAGILILLGIAVYKSRQAYLKKTAWQRRTKRRR